MGGFDSRDANDVFVRRGNADDQAPAPVVSAATWVPMAPQPVGPPVVSARQTLLATAARQTREKRQGNEGASGKDLLGRRVTDRDMAAGVEADGRRQVFRQEQVVVPNNQVADDLLSCLNADTRHTFSGKGLFNRDFQEAFDAVQQAYPSNPATQLSEFLALMRRNSMEVWKSYSDFSCVVYRSEPGAVGAIYEMFDAVCNRTGGLVLLRVYSSKARKLYPASVLADVKYSLGMTGAPNVLHTLSVFEAGGDLIIVQRHLGLCQLEHVLFVRGPFVGQGFVAHFIVQPLLAALAQVHASGLVHCGIYPSNVTISTDGAAHLINFGVTVDVVGGRAGETPPPFQVLEVRLAYTPPELIRILNAVATRGDFARRRNLSSRRNLLSRLFPTLTRGRTGYRIGAKSLGRGLSGARGKGRAKQTADEDALFATLTPACDIWMLGCLVYELLVGRQVPPLVQEFQESARFTVPFGKESPDLYFPPRVSPECRDFITQCLQYDPFDRPTVAELERHPWMSVSMDGCLSELQSLIHAVLEEGSEQEDTGDLYRLDRKGSLHSTAADIAFKQARRLASTADGDDRAPLSPGAGPSSAGVPSRPSRHSTAARSRRITGRKSGVADGPGESSQGEPSDGGAQRPSMRSHIEGAPSTLVRQLQDMHARRQRKAVTAPPTDRRRQLSGQSKLFKQVSRKGSFRSSIPMSSTSPGPIVSLGSPTDAQPLAPVASMAIARVTRVPSNRVIAPVGSLPARADRRHASLGARPLAPVMSPTMLMQRMASQRNLSSKNIGLTD